MDSNTTPQCRLCLETSDDLVNIFDSFQDSTIASILTQHFWFQVHKNDGLSECLCQTCWTNTETFHNFYTKIELIQKDYWNLVEKESGDPDIANSIKEEQSGNPNETSLQIDFTLVKNEEPSFEVIDVQASKDVKEESSDYDDDNSSTRSENVHSSDDDYQQPIKRRDKKTKENQSLASAKRFNGETTTPFDKDKEDAQIREYFTMNCDICSDAEFATLREATKHHRTVHKQCGYLTCCGRKFFRRHKVLNHIHYHLNPDAYRCEQCGKRFADKFALQNHIANHEPRTSRAFKCNLCSSSFTKATTLKYHVQNTHSMKKGVTFPCEKCKKSFRTEHLLACHIRGIHESTKSQVCDICARAFRTKQELKNHMPEHSTTPLPKMQCNICGAWMKNGKSLRHHLNRHKDAKAVDCPICKKVVKNKHALYNHKQVHSERRHQCTMCDKAFKTLTMLKEHVAIHTGEYLYNCPYCDRKFKSNANMFSHRKKTHFAEWTRDHAKKGGIEKDMTGVMDEGNEGVVGKDQN